VDDSYIPGWKRLADYAHSFGCCLGVQLGEFGPQAMNYMSDLKPEDEKYKFFTFSGEDELPQRKIWTVEELDRMAEAVAQCGRRAKEAGLDCVEIHAAHSTGLMYANALDPFFNNREDAYGGDIERNFHLLEKTVTRMRELVGPDYPIFVRINGDDLKGQLGNTNEDVCKYLVPILERIGVDVIDISQGGPMYTTEGPLPPMYYPRGCWMHLSGAVKKATKLPVVGAGRITTMEMAAKYIEEDVVDIIYLGRELYADGEVIRNYLKDGCECNTRQCIACLQPGCMPCTVNYKERFAALMGKLPFQNQMVEDPKKVLVIGGGVAGMEAARVAAEQGHKVTLWERDGRLGGNIGTLSEVSLTSEFRNIIEYQQHQLSNLNVEVRCCCTATLEKVRELAPDVVLLATGFDMPLPEYLQGGLMVMDHMSAIRRRREFRSLGQWHKKVVIYGFPASEFALDLAESGCEVTLMGPGKDTTIAAEGYITRERKIFLRRKLTNINYIREGECSQHVTNPLVLTHVKLEGVDAEGVHYYHNGIHKTRPYDVLIYSGPRKKNDEIFEELEKLVPSVIKIGDCNKAGNIRDAIISANNAARSIR
jgi:2,4-dienoyl-CoA reductase-like NADH-dependent reductase (Old Yellow Enzyme family)/thioredoxin reductase